MAEVYTRLRVESEEYDAKIKHATEGLLHMEEACRKAGGTLEILDEEDKQFVQSLGRMETVSRDAAGKVNELSQAFVSLSVQYKNLTAAEKKGDMGKGLSASLAQLKKRINDAKADLHAAQAEIADTGNILEAIASKMGVPVNMLTKFGAVAAASTAALKVMKDAFLDTEEGIDSFGRAVAASKNVYTTFLDTLNNGNWSEFFSNLFKAIGGARELYNAMDRLKSVKSNNAAAIAETQSLIQQLRLRQQKGENVVKELKTAEERLRSLQVQTVEAGKTAGRTQMTETLRRTTASMEGASVSTEAISNAVEQLIHSGQDAFDHYRDLANSLEQKGSREEIVGFDGSRELLGQVFRFENLSEADQALYKLAKAITDSETKLQEGISIYAQAAQTDTTSNREAVRTQRYVQRGEKALATPKGKSFGADMSTMPELGSLADLENQAKLVREAMKGATSVEEYQEMENHLNTIIAQMNELKGIIPEAFAPGSMNDLKAQLKEAQDLLNSLTPGTKDWADAFLLVQERQHAVTNLQEQMTVKVAETVSEFEAMRNELDTMEKGVSAISTLGNSLNDLKSIIEDVRDAFSGEMDAWDAMMTVFNSGIGVMETVIGVMEAINTLSELSATLSDIKIAKQMQETSTVVAGKAAETTADLTEASAAAASTGVTTGEAVSKAADSVAGIPVVGPVLAVAAAATVLGSIIAAVMSAKSSVGKFAEGGIVPGNSFHGDHLTAAVNSGELILSRSQQDSIASQLQNGNPFANLRLTTEISGANLRVVLNNDNRSRGGERTFYSEIH